MDHGKHMQKSSLIVNLAIIRNLWHKPNINYLLLLCELFTFVEYTFRWPIRINNKHSDDSQPQVATSFIHYIVILCPHHIPGASAFRFWWNPHNTDITHQSYQSQSLLVSQVWMVNCHFLPGEIPMKYSPSHIPKPWEDRFPRRCRRGWRRPTPQVLWGSSSNFWGFPMDFRKAGHDPQNWDEDKD